MYFDDIFVKNILFLNGWKAVNVLKIDLKALDSNFNAKT